MSAATYLIDTSAAARLLSDADDRFGWRRAIGAGLVAMADVTELEIGYAARSAMDRKRLMDVLHASFLWCPVPDGAFDRAREVQELLTARGEHRSAGKVDLLLAATAELSGLTVLHEDRDFETVARVTGQPTAMLTAGSPGPAGQ